MLIFDDLKIRYSDILADVFSVLSDTKYAQFFLNFVRYIYLFTHLPFAWACSDQLVVVANRELESALWW